MNERAWEMRQDRIAEDTEAEFRALEDQLDAAEKKIARVRKVILGRRTVATAAIERALDGDAS